MNGTPETVIGGGGGQQTQISDDECFELLSNHRRRYVLQYLREQQNSATLSELSDQIAAWENEKTIEDVTPTERKRVYTSLQQIHLPQMAEMGVIRYDDSDKTVEVGPSVEDIDVYLDVVRERDVPWSRLYLTLALANAILLIGVGLNIPPLTSLTDLGWAFVTVTVFLVAALSHAYHIEKRRNTTWFPSPSEQE